jgi:Ca-activated chloride channel family protein
MHIQADRFCVPAGAPAVRYLHIVLNAPVRPSDAAPRAPVSVALVLDRSGSMDGKKIEMAREAVAHATKLLKPTDHLAIVCYDEQITTVLDRTHATEEAKKLAVDRLATIGARGATDLHGGWMRGADLAGSSTADDVGVSKVMLLTDGLANRGVVDRTELIAKAGQLRGRVLTSTFGVGQDFDEDLLSRIATEGGGHFYFIEGPKQIPDFLASELGETLEVVARDVTLEISCDPGVDAVSLIELPSTKHGDVTSIRIGNLVSDQEVSLVVAMTFNGTQGEGTGLGVQCTVKDRDDVLAPHPMSIKWEAVDAAKDRSQPVNGDVVYKVASVIAGRARRAALAANAAGDFEQAKRIIEGVLNDLRAMAQDERRVLRIIDELHRDALEVSEMMAPMARKAKQFVFYQEAYSREEGGTARRTNRPR